MKKLGLICLVLIIALGAIGAGYAAWTDILQVNGTVTTGLLAWEITSAGCKDNFEGVPDPIVTVWPNVGYSAVNYAGPTKLHLGPADSEFPSSDTDRDGQTGHLDTLYVVLQDAYPGYVEKIDFDVINKGTIPLKFTQVDINGIVFGLHETKELDLNDDGVNDVKIYWNNNIGSVYYPDVPGDTLTFTILILEGAPPSTNLEYVIKLLGEQYTP